MELKGVQHPTFANEGRARKRISDVNIRKRKNNKKRNTTPYYNLIVGILAWWYVEQQQVHVRIVVSRPEGLLVRREPPCYKAARNRARWHRRLR